MEPRNNHSFDAFGPDAEMESDDGLDNSVGFDFNDPAQLSGLMGIPNIPHMSPDAVRLEAARRSGSIMSNYHRLQAILQRHEATIRKRWPKKKSQQRLQVLLNAWPDMAKTHRPDFDAFRKESKQPQGPTVKYKDCYMWPYINQEDLSGPNMLLLLLNSRGRHHPSYFAAADGEAMHLGTVSTRLVPVFLNEHVMLLNGIHDPQEYGKLLAWEDHPDAFDWLHTQKQFLPGSGLFVLEAQDRLLSFLVSCCTQILHDIPGDELGSDRFPILPEPQLKNENEQGSIKSLAIMAAEAPYRVPAKLDLGQVEGLLRAKAAACEDHLWSLREDPNYFAERLLIHADHRPERVADANGKTHPAFSSGRPTVLQNNVARIMLAQAHLELELVSELYQQAQDMRALHSKHAAAIAPEKALPEEFMTAILKFRFYMSQAIKEPLMQLKDMFPASPPVRKYFERLPPSDPSSSKIKIASRNHPQMNKVEKQLRWLLSTIWEDGHTLFLMRLSTVLDELQRLRLAERAANALLSNLVAETLGTLSIYVQCMNQLDLYQPWANTYETEMLSRKDAFQASLNKSCCRRWTELLKVLGPGNFCRATKECDFDPRNFVYPSGRRRNKETTETMRLAEQKLDAFWTIIDGLFRTRCSDLGDMALGRLLSSGRTVERTPPWVDQPAPASKGRGKPRDVNLDVESIYKPLSTLFIGSRADHSAPSRPEIKTAKTKTKTRGEPSQDSAQADDDEEAVAAAAGAASATTTAPKPDPIVVDARALKVFRTLFFDPSVTSSPGEVSWSDFVYAMTSTRLFGAEQMYGSVWQFCRTDGADQSRILFHEPHPHAKIPFYMARRHGRRLHRAYGWHSGAFVLKGSS